MRSREVLELVEIFTYRTTEGYEASYDATVLEDGKLVALEGRFVIGLDLCTIFVDCRDGCHPGLWLDQGFR